MRLLGSKRLSPSPLLRCGTAGVPTGPLWVALASPGVDFVPLAPRRLNYQRVEELGASSGAPWGWRCLQGKTGSALFHTVSFFHVDGRHKSLCGTKPPRISVICPGLGPSAARRGRFVLWLLFFG